MTSASRDTEVQRHLDAPMLWIGNYVAAASLVCTLAMAADIFHGLRNRNFWFPSKYFALNATSLTFLTVALSLPVDLTTRMYAVTDRLAKVSSLALLSTSMANFLPSLGSMDDKDILSNVIALAILVITVFVDFCIQIFVMQPFLSGRLAFAEEIIAIVCMLLLLIMTISSALMISSAKRNLEKKYHEMSKTALKEENVKMGRVSTDKLRVVVKKCWLMAESSSPQFVIARSVISTTSGVMSMLIALVLVEAQIRLATEGSILNLSESNYKWSTKWILLFQSTGVIIGTITPVCRWFNVTRFKYSITGSNGIKSVFAIEGYWTRKMVEWKQSALPVEIRRLKCRKVVHYARGVILNFCILVQYLIVLYSKLLLIISICLTSPFASCFKYVRRLKLHMCKSAGGHSHSHEISGLTANSVRDYVMLLEDEKDLSRETLKNICKEVYKVIQRGKTKKPKDLLKFLCKSNNFSGLVDFNSRIVPSLNAQEIPYCWSLPVVTLTTIALALPNVEKHKSDHLRNSVIEGLKYVKLVDKILDEEGGLENIRNAADIAWVGVELYSKWQDMDLQETSVKLKNSRETLLQLSNGAESAVAEFQRNAEDILMTDPLNWPADVIAANSMYRISRTIFLNHESEYQTDDGLFEQLSVMIADIMAACFTNLGRVVVMKCYCNAIEEREKSVRQAALLLGETEEILALLQQQELPPLLTPEQAAHIEEWRSLSNQVNKNNRASISRSDSETNATKSREEHVAINVNG